ncbi:MAG: Hpt domain-containing protein, partial [Gammaproteobacteria bacterium]|nr:Hpt domain-containing protein [Gammaproteobacteria bacterium]
SMPFIILTANATQEATKACEETGAEAYITKPIRAHLLVDKIHNLINIKVKDTIIVKNGTHNDDAILDYDQINIINDKEVFENMVKIFSDNLQVNINKITEAINNDDYSEYKIVLHSLKGISGNFGAIQLYKVVVDAEKITHTQFLQGATEQATLVTYEIHRACKALQDYANTLVKS